MMPNTNKKIYGESLKFDKLNFLYYNLINLVTLKQNDECYKIFMVSLGVVLLRFQIKRIYSLWNLW